MKQTAIPVVCPACRGHLEFKGETILCRACGASHCYRDGFLDLTLGDRFDDQNDPDRQAYEIVSNRHLVEHYLVPALSRIFAGGGARLLSLGCGVGIDVDVLTDARFEVVGIDCGNRSLSWQERIHRERFYLANGKHLPFPDSSFDLVYCGCVFPHVGIEGDSNRVLPNYREQRLQIAHEITRVLKPGGRILVSSPNRRFPLDLFHGRDPSHPYPRWNPPNSPFLLSAADYGRIFTEAGCVSFRALPVNGYWGFHRMKHSWKGRILALPVEAVFGLVSFPALAFLRTWPISPWLVMLMQKPGGERPGSGL